MRGFLAVHAVAAAWLGLSRLHRLQSCDSVVFSLASLYEWTPFFWEQDRVGLLLPLVASPVTHPLANLVVLTALMSFCGLVAPLLLAWLVCPRPGAYAAVTVGNALMIAIGPKVLQENLYTTCVYPLAVCLVVPAVRLLDRPGGWRVAAAGGLTLLAHWTYLGAAVFLLPLAGGRFLADPTWGRFWAAVRVGAVVVASVGVMSGAAGEWRRTHPEIPDTPTSGLPVVDWPENWLQFLRSLAAVDGFGPWAVALFVVSAAGLAVPAAGRPCRRMLFPLVVAAGGEVLLLGTRAWPAMNSHHPRYLLAAVSAVTTAVLVVALAPWLAGRRGYLSVGLLAAAIGYQYGPPSVANVRAELGAEAGKDAADFLASGADAVGGEYMATWPAVWHANLARHELGLPTPVSGVTAKAAPWRHRWAEPFRLAAPFDQEQQARRWVAHYGLEVVGGPERAGRLIVLTVRPAG